MNKEYERVRGKVAEATFNIIVESDQRTRKSLLENYGIDIGEYTTWHELIEDARNKYLKKADQILSIKGIAILSDDQSLPEYPLTDSENSVFYSGTCKKAQKDMLKAGFVKVVKEGE